MFWPVLLRLQGGRKGSDGSRLSEVHIFDSEYAAYRIVNILHNLVWHESVVNGQRKRAKFEFIDERKQERRNCHVRL